MSLRFIIQTIEYRGADSTKEIKAQRIFPDSVIYIGAEDNSTINSDLIEINQGLIFTEKNKPYYINSSKKPTTILRKGKEIKAGYKTYLEIGDIIKIRKNGPFRGIDIFLSDISNSQI